MKNKWTTMVLGAAMAAASLAWGATEPQIRVEVRGVQTLLQEIQAAGKGTALESSAPFFPLTLRQALDVDLVNLLQGDATASATLYADMPLLDAAFADRDDEDKIEAFLNSIVAVFEFVPRNPDRFWRAWEKAYPLGDAPAAHPDWRTFRRNEFSDDVFYGATSGNGHAFLALGDDADTTTAILASAIAASDAGDGWTLEVPGTLAAGGADYGVLAKVYAQATLAAGEVDWDVPDFVVDSTWKAAETGIGVAGDTLRVNVLAECAEEGFGAEIVEAWRAYPDFSDADPVQVVDRAGAIAVGEGRFAGKILEDYFARRFSAQNALFRQMGIAENEILDKICGDVRAAAAHFGNGSMGIVAMRRNGRERGLPPLAVYLSGIEDAPACRQAIAEGVAGWPANLFGRYFPGEDIDPAEMPLDIRLLGTRELAGAEVDTYEFSFADSPACEFWRESGFELPLGIGLAEFAWIGDSQLIASTLVPAELDKMLVDLQDGHFRRIRDNPRFAELFPAPGPGDKELGYTIVNVLDLLRDGVDLAADWIAAASGEDFRENETFAKFWASLPADPGIVAARSWLTPDELYAEEMAVPLAPFRDAWIQCFSVGLNLVSGAIRDASSDAECAAGFYPDEDWDCDLEEDSAPDAD